MQIVNSTPFLTIVMQGLIAHLRGERQYKSYFVSQVCDGGISQNIENDQFSIKSLLS